MDGPAGRQRGTPSEPGDQPRLRNLVHAVAALREVLDQATQRRLVLAVAASVGIALIEVAGLVVVIPLLTILADGVLPAEGLSAEIVGWTGSTDPDRVVLILTLAAFGCFVLRAVTTLIVRWWIFGRIFEDEARTSARLLRRYLSAPYAFHLRTNSTQLLRTLTLSVDQTYSRVIVGLITIATELVVALATVTLLAVSEPLAALALFAYFALATFVMARAVSARSRRVGQRFQQHNADVLKEAAQAFGAIKHIQLGAHEDHFVQRLEHVRRQSSDTKRKIQFLAEVPRQYFELAFVVGIGLMIVTVSVLQGSSSVVAAIGLFAVAGFRLLPGLVRISNSNQALQGGLPALQLVLDALALPAAPADPVAIDPDAVFQYSLQLRDLSFRYPEAAVDALTDVDLTLAPGDTVALVGPSGAGKSTLIDLIMGLHPPTTGELLVDRRPLSDVRSAWQRGIGLVPQDIFLLDATIAENLAFGDRVDEIDQERLDEVVRLAQLGDLVAELPDGLRTVVGERGVRLSGGQRQRLGIARALYRRPRLLVLDEATSALDSVTEERITTTLRALRGRLTIITIAHRLSTVRDADRLVLMDEGRVVDEGPFEQLRDRNASFRRLVDVAALE
ncbi:MAG: ABC transporter ATP-binding protein [Ilumatobacteraceae bacterium]